MPSARFDLDASALVFSRAPLRPERSLELIQAEAQSAGGVRFGFDSYAAEDLIPLRWQGMSSADLAALLTFAADVAGWMANAFTYTDTEGTAHGVRLAAAEISHRETAHGRHAVSLLLVRT
jgi:hypothetical protein